MANNDIGGVWRTIGKRRVFIKTGKSLSEAMQESGKFNNNKIVEKDYESLNDDQKERINELNKKIKEQNKIAYGKSANEGEKKEALEKMKELKNEKEKVYKGEYEKPIEKDTKTNDNEFAQKLINKDKKKIIKDLEYELSDIEQYESENGIGENLINEKIEELTFYKKINQMYDDGEINDNVYELYTTFVRNKVEDIMDSKGYDIYTKGLHTYYSFTPKAKKGYDELLNELDKRNINYEVSRSWNKGELPSVYVKDKDDNVFRIANHYNNKNPEYDGFRQNKIYNVKDYVNYKDTILKDLDDFLGETTKKTNNNPYRKAFLEYKKEHPNTKLTLQEFKKMSE